MKKVLAVATLLVALVGGAVFASSVLVGDIYLDNYTFRWYDCVPQATVVQGSSSNCFNVYVSGLRYGQVTLMYVLVDGNQLIYFSSVRCNGYYRISIPSRYNQGRLRAGQQNIVVILTSSERFSLENYFRPQPLGSWNFIGYPHSGYFVLTQASFCVPSCSCRCYYNCCRP